MTRLKQALTQLRRNRRKIIPDREVHYVDNGLVPVVTGDPAVFDGVGATAEELVAYVEMGMIRERRQNSLMLRYAMAGLATEMTMHEANSLLGSMRRQVDALKEKDPERFARMDYSLRKLSSNFDFLTMFKADRRWTSFKTDTAGLVESVDHEFGLAIQRGQLVIETTDRFLKSTVQVDDAIFHAVCINLVRNAYQWGNRSGKSPVVVRFDSERVEHPVKGWDDELEVETEEMGFTDILIVEDNGPGLAPDAGDEIFKPGVSGRGSSGIGLYLCKAALESRGYTIVADGGDRSKLGGAKFRIGSARILRPAIEHVYGAKADQPTEVELELAEAVESMTSLLEEGHHAEVADLSDIYQDAAGAALRIRLRGAETAGEERLIEAVGAFEEALRHTRPTLRVAAKSPAPK